MTSRSSSYLDSLSDKDRRDYFNKLILSNGVKLGLPDPLTIEDDKWVVDMSKWPSIVWPDIYSYLVERPSVYTKEKLRAYKSLDAYNYVLSGNVQPVHFIDAGHGFCFLRAAVGNFPVAFWTFRRPICSPNSVKP